MADQPQITPAQPAAAQPAAAPSGKAAGLTPQQSFQQSQLGIKPAVTGPVPTTGHYNQPGEFPHQTGAPKHSALDVFGPTEQEDQYLNPDSDYNKRQADLTSKAQLYGTIRNLPPDQQALALQKLHMTPEGFSADYQHLKQQLMTGQQQAAQVSQEEGTKAKKYETAATATQVAGETAVLMGQAGIMLAGGPITWPMVVTRVAQAAALMKFGSMGEDFMSDMAHRVFPNMGPNADLAVRVVGGVLASVALGGGMNMAEMAARGELSTVTAAGAAGVKAAAEAPTEAPAAAAPAAEAAPAAAAAPKGTVPEMLTPEYEQQVAKAGEERGYEYPRQAPAKSIGNQPGQADVGRTSWINKEEGQTLPPKGPPAAPTEEQPAPTPAERLADKVANPEPAEQEAQRVSRSYTQKLLNIIKKPFGIKTLDDDGKVADMTDEGKAPKKLDREKVIDAAKDQLKEQGRDATRDEIRDKYVEKEGEILAEAGMGKKAPLGVKEPAIGAKLADQIIHQRQVNIAQRLNLKDNSAYMNKLDKIPGDHEFTEDEHAEMDEARKISSNNFHKLSVDYMHAMGVGDAQKMTDIEHLASGEWGKLLSIANRDQKFTFKGTYADQTFALVKSVTEMPKLMRAVSTLESKEQPEKINRFFSDYINNIDLYKAAVNAQMLSPKVAIEKTMSDVAWMPYNQAVRAVGNIREVGVENAARLYVTSMHAGLGAFRDAMGYAVKSFKSGSPEFLRSLGPQPETEASITDEFANTVPGKAANFASSIYSAGSRAVMSADQFAKTISYRMNLRNNAMMKALQDAQDQGVTGGAQWKYAEVLAENYIKENPGWLQRATMSNMAKETFTNDRMLSTQIQRLAKWATIPKSTYTPEIPIGRMYAMFVRTPLNMLDSGIYNSAFSPVSPQFWQGMAAGGVARDQALAHWAVGSMNTALVWHYAHKGNITGAGPVNKTSLQEMRSKGWQPFSIGFQGKDGTWHYLSYKHLGPIYNMIGPAATFSERYHEIPQGQQGKLVKAAIATLAGVAHNGPAMYDVGSFFNGLDEISQHGETGDIERFLATPFTSLVPSPLKTAAEIVSPYQTNPQDFLDKIAEQSPWNRAGVAVKYDQFGYPMAVPPGLDRGDLASNRWAVALSSVNPLTYSTYKPDNVDNEVVRTGANIPNWPDTFVGKRPPTSMFSDPNDPMIGMPFSGDPVKNAKMEARLAELGGHESVDGEGRNYHDYLDHTINMPQYRRSNIDIQRKMVEQAHTRYLNLGKRDLQHEYPELRQDLHQYYHERRRALMSP